METKKGTFKCPRCCRDPYLSSLSSSTHYSTWIEWQKRDDKWIIGCVGYIGEKPIWWWDIFSYTHTENGDEKCWDIRGGSTEEKWLEGHYQWKCERCGHKAKSFTNFIENVETLDDDNEDDDDIY